MVMTSLFLLNSSFSCGHNAIKVMTEASITIEPDYVLLADNDTVQFNTKLRVPLRVLKRNKELKLFVYLTSGQERQLLHEVNFHKAEKGRKYGFIEKSDMIKQPVLISSETGSYNIEMRWVFIHKTGSYTPSESLWMGKIFTDSTEYFKFRKEHAEFNSR